MHHETARRGTGAHREISGTVLRSGSMEERGGRKKDFPDLEAKLVRAGIERRRRMRTGALGRERQRQPIPLPMMRSYRGQLRTGSPASGDPPL